MVMEREQDVALGDALARWPQAADDDDAVRARVLLGAISEVVIETDRSGMIRWISPSCTLTLGWTPAQLIGTDAGDLAHPDDFPALLAYRNALTLVSGGLEAPEIRFRTAEGGYRWTWLETRPLRAGDGSIVGLVSTLRDAQEEVMLRRALLTLSAGTRILVHAVDEADLLQQMCQSAVDVGGYALSWYGRKVHDVAHSVDPIGCSLQHADYVAAITTTWADEPLGRGPTGTAIRTGATQSMARADESRDFAPWREVAAARGFRSAISVPVVVDGEVDGALMVYALEEDAFDARSIATFEDLAHEIGYGLHRLRDAKRLEQAFVSAIDLLAAAVESRDAYTAGHQAAVADLAAAVARELGLDEDTITGITYGARVHDLGKIAVPIEILTHPGKLDDEQMTLVREHTNVGWEIASRFHWPWPVADMVRQHHERLDGSGYPLGLRGDEICLEARIIAVADVYEAVAADRPYRSSMGAEKSWALIESGRGSHFDPEVVDALERVLAEGYTLPTHPT
jgi:PAS domain S-box-containing protein/putative nucleotidyltransferase with HDIG domain